MNPLNFFSNLAFLNRVSPVGATYEGIVSCALARLASTVSLTLPRRNSHTARLTLSDMARLSRAEGTDVTGVPKGPDPSSLSSFSLSSFSLSSIVAAPLTILAISPPYEACGILNHLHELVSKSRWVHMSSLPSHLIVFQKFLFG
jgi:hypothetical protein